MFDTNKRVVGDGNPTTQPGFLPTRPEYERLMAIETRLRRYRAAAALMFNEGVPVGARLLKDLDEILGDK